MEKSPDFHKRLSPHFTNKPTHGSRGTVPGQFTLLFASRTDTAEEMFDTITHELKHATEHISGFYGVDPKSEEAAYLQGEMARKMFPAVALAVCPKCIGEKEEE